MEETLRYIDIVLDGRWVTSFMRPADAQAWTQAANDGDAHYQSEPTGAVELEVPTSDGPASVMCWRYRLTLTQGGMAHDVEAFVPLANRSSEAPPPE